MYGFPKTKIGKISFWIAISAFILMYLQYWYAMLFKTSVPPIMGLLAVLCVCVAGVTSIIALTKYRDHAILLFLSALIGVFGFLLVIGEFFFPH